MLGKPQEGRPLPQTIPTPNGNMVVDSGPNKGLALGQYGEFYRYMHVFHNKPSDEDRVEALRVADWIRCDVCFVISKGLIAKADDLSEDAIAEILEGHTEYPKSGEKVKDQMLQHKKGCQKHFKDEMVAQGWVLKMCSETGEVGKDNRSAKDPCIHQENDRPSPMATDTYELAKEALYYACEQSVGKYNDDMALYLAEHLPKAEDKDSILREACAGPARCKRKHKDLPPPNKTAKKSKKKKSGGGKRKRRRSSKSAGFQSEL